MYTNFCCAACTSKTIPAVKSLSEWHTRGLVHACTKVFNDAALLHSPCSPTCIQQCCTTIQYCAYAIPPSLRAYFRSTTRKSFPDVRFMVDRLARPVVKRMAIFSCNWFFFFFFSFPDIMPEHHYQTSSIHPSIHPQ